MTNVIDGPLRVNGRLTPQQLDVPDGTIEDKDVSDSAGIGAHKLEHEYRRGLRRGGTVAAAREPLHTVRGAAGRVLEFFAWLRVPCTGDATVTVDLLKAGQSVLSSPVTLDSTQSAYQVVEATLDPSKQDLVKNDVLEVDVQVSAGTGTLGQDLMAEVTLREDAV